MDRGMEGSFASSEGRGGRGSGPRCVTNTSLSFYHGNNLSLVSCVNLGVSPRFPIALPILYTSSKATSVGTKPIARYIAASFGTIPKYPQLRAL